MLRLVTGAALAGMFLASNVSAQPEVEFSGSAQYRVRANIDRGTTSDGADRPSESDTHHQYGWSLGVDAKANDQVGLRFQIENVGLNSFSRRVDDNEGPASGSDIHNLVVSQAYLSWETTIFGVEAGIVPVSANSAYDAGYHVSRGSSHFDRSVAWNEIGSVAGINVGVKAGDAVKINLNTSTKGNTGRLIHDNDDQVLDGYRIGLNAPISVGTMTFTPAAFLETGIYKEDTEGNAIPGESNMALAFGLDLRARPTGKVDLRGGFGYGMLEVEDQTDRNTIYFQLHPRFSLPGGRLVTAYSLGIAQDELTEVSFMRHYVDINYTHNINSHLSIRPRVRTYISSNDFDDDQRTRIRPELIFAARF
ncbi:hypothetical protein QA601_01195 [Chitinispirillales bacterium ANBcel5]|uniref:hypothetical protein n=1 Tax=Cellulosispirillum alkaliphilum TaxID=3039283 RepID=UPI002A580F06|nr:hypothetical protein [Chitinispirillales bacterium ANBcel5]